jgi:cell division protein FtsZ
VNVDFEDVKTVMQDSGAAVMGSAIVGGEERALKAAQQAIASPLLNNTDIHGAKKILLSITSGENAELQMDELSDITDYIQQEAGEAAEVIFGHGVDPELEDSINVTVIATGFQTGNSEIKFNDKKKVIDLESSKQIRLFDEDLLKEDKTSQLEKDPEKKSGEKEKKGYHFEKPGKESIDEEKKPEKVFFRLDENGNPPKETSENLSAENQDKSILEEKKSFLLKQAKERSEKLSKVKNYSISDDEYKERWDVPAYLRKKVKLEDIPHSSEHEISRYNLNDENQILGNNKFLHDNVD